MFRTSLGGSAPSSTPTSRPWRGHVVRMAVPVTALVAAATACGPSGDPTGSSNAATSPPAVATHSPAMTTAPPPGTSGTGGEIATATARGLGRILADGEGRTVYLFEKDKDGRSSCSGACAALWPPVTTTGRPNAGPGAQASKLGTTSRSDGRKQVTYGGHPLYYYGPDGDTKGSTKGEGLNQFGGGWFVVAPDGQKVEQNTGAPGGGY